MIKVKVITANSESFFESKFDEALRELEAHDKVVDIEFATDAIPERPGTFRSTHVYYTAFIKYEPEAELRRRPTLRRPTVPR